MTTGVRRKARECALMILYEIDLLGVAPAAATEHFWEALSEDEPLDVPPAFEPAETSERDWSEDKWKASSEVVQHAEALVYGVVGQRDALDQQILQVSQNWRIERMSCVDRNLLRLGAYELTALAEQVPRKVAINEAVEIAKRFGTAESAAFINGILDRIGAKS